MSAAERAGQALECAQCKNSSQIAQKVFDAMGVRLLATENRVLLASKMRDLDLQGPTGMDHQVSTQTGHYWNWVEQQGIHNKQLVRKDITEIAQDMYEHDEEHEEVLRAEESEHQELGKQDDPQRAIDLEYDRFKKDATVRTSKKKILSKEKIVLFRINLPVGWSGAVKSVSLWGPSS